MPIRFCIILTLWRAKTMEKYKICTEYVVEMQPHLKKSFCEALILPKSKKTQ
jgi:hypothetical protein